MTLDKFAVSGTVAARSVISVLDEMGSMQASYSYDAFGEITAEEETFNNDYKYVGQKGVLSQSLGKPAMLYLFHM